jgi:ubiquitin C-terminal hydrolase
MKLVGFLNLGNTCYINSILQCFVYDQLFITNLVDTLPIGKLLLDITGNIDLEQNHENLIIPYNLTKFVDYFISQKTWFHKYQQNDAHEFLTNFIDLVCNPVIGVNQCLGGPDELWNHFLKCNDSPFTMIYHGQTRTCTKCLKCNSHSNRYEEFNTINLNVPLTTPGSLTDLFVDYLKKEVHTDSKNLYYCDKCEQEVESEKKVSLYRLPSRLIIVLKKYLNKINVKIENLTIKESISGKLMKYRLSGIVKHSGNLHDGHYTSNVLINDKWYFIDDHKIYLNDSLVIDDPDAYILVFNLIPN